jgi:hypothetical protein
MSNGDRPASYRHKLTGDQLTAAVAERIEAGRRTPTLGCAACTPAQACSPHLAEHLMQLVRSEDLVLMPLAYADAIIYESVQRLTGGQQ